MSGGYCNFMRYRNCWFRHLKFNTKAPRVVGEREGKERSFDGRAGSKTGMCSMFIAVLNERKGAEQQIYGENAYFKGEQSELSVGSKPVAISGLHPFDGIFILKSKQISVTIWEDISS